jgi:Mn-dependent DtxR family transcriptional regulator
MAKLRSPLHVNFVAHLLKISPEEAIDILKEMEKNGLVEEYNPQVGKDYYVIKN